MTTLYGLFAEQAARTPAAVAVTAGGASWTYAELAARVAGLGAHLGRLGVAPGTVVGVSMERTAELPAALLAVLAAGAAYVPLDPAYPAERLGFIVEDSAAGVILTQSHLRDRLPPCGAAIVEIDALGLLDARGDDNARGRAGAGDLAYLIFTSGSTGRPKGVAIEHRAAVALVDWARRVFSAAELAGVLASTSINFDLSVFELFVPLAAGGRVILCENALALASLPARAEVTLVNTVPSAARELLRLGAVPASVRVVNLAGEPLPRELAEGIYGLGTVEKLYNLYGPSEDTTYSTWSLVPRRLSGRPAIGRPVAGTRVRLLDRRGEPVAGGERGELHLGGAGLARGYHGRPALTAERFVPDGFGVEAGGRLYRTGDLAAWGAGGELDFFGRVDHQVKVRGYRIELGEVEEALRRHPGVRDAAAAARAGAAGELRLVAYVVGEDGPPPAEELRAHLRATLPEYMVPAVLASLPEIPLTPNGKVDRKALPEPGDGLAGNGKWVPPEGPTEETLASIWAQLLGLPRVGAEDHFFDIGGHSLLVPQLLARIEGAFGVALPVRSLIDSPTLAELALAIEESLLDEIEALEGAATS